MDKKEKSAEDGCVRTESARDIRLPALPKSLSLEEKKYLLAVERGDLTTVKRLLQRARRTKSLNVNCRDPLGRGALLMAIDNENLQMVELLVIMGVATEDALLHAIDKEFVEAVELLLEHEELVHKEGEPYSWEKVDRTIAAFTPEITPLILAAHRNNYEILKILLDRGATLPMPHDVRCGCTECILSIQEDSLRHSMSRINAYKALASPSLIALSSTDPILTAFELSAELRNLAYTENEFRQDYLDLRRQCQTFAVELLSHTRSSQELAIVLNHDPLSPPYEDGEHMNLTRLRLAIEHKQKKFVAHPNIQQLLGSIWYEGLPGFRRKSPVEKVFEVCKIAALFPFFCVMYMLFPNSGNGQLMRKPFMKFLIHASSYLFFLFLLILVSQRAEVIAISLFGTQSMKLALADQLKRHRGNGPTVLECAVVCYVFGFLVEDLKELYRQGFGRYIKNLWNFIDMSRNFGYIMVITLRAVAYYRQQKEIAANPSSAYIPREEWDDFDPQLVADGLFAMSNVFSALKLVHLFSINPYLGPLQICLGRMVIDIVKFFFIYTLVLFAFACGLNQLLWYYSDIEFQKCYSTPDGSADWGKNPEACMKWRRFHNLFETSQSLFWASFGMIGLDNFELSGIKSYTRFWGLLMFGSYSVINVVVLLNLLIAMMSNSYAMITEHADTEWKFARSRLWLSYFEEGGTLPPPFNLLPTPKDILKAMGVREKDKLRRLSSRRRSSKIRERDFRYAAVMRALVWRFITNMHRQNENSEVTEDDISEVKGDISSLRFELIDIFRKNNMDVSTASKNTQAAIGRKMRVWERRLLRDFHVVSVAGEEPEDGQTGDVDDIDPVGKFRKLAMMAVQANREGSDQVGSGRNIKMLSQIGRSTSSESFKSCQNLKKAMAEANKLAIMEPTPDASPRLTPVPTAGASVLELIKSLDDDKSDCESVNDFEEVKVPKFLQDMKQQKAAPELSVPALSVTPATPAAGLSNAKQLFKTTAPSPQDIPQKTEVKMQEPLEPLRTGFTPASAPRAIPPPPQNSRAAGGSAGKKQIAVIKKEISLEMPDDDVRKNDVVIDMKSKTLENIKESKLDIDIPKNDKSKTTELPKSHGGSAKDEIKPALTPRNSMEAGVILTPKILEPSQAKANNEQKEVPKPAQVAAAPKHSQNCPKGGEKSASDKAAAPAKSTHAPVQPSKQAEPTPSVSKPTQPQTSKPAETTSSAGKPAETKPVQAPKPAQPVSKSTEVGLPQKPKENTEVAKPAQTAAPSKPADNTTAKPATTPSAPAKPASAPEPSTAPSSAVGPSSSLAPKSVEDVKTIKKDKSGWL